MKARCYFGRQGIHFQCVIAVCIHVQNNFKTLYSLYACVCEVVMRVRDILITYQNMNVEVVLVEAELCSCLCG